jgi:rod shape-determining protein MreC
LLWTHPDFRVSSMSPDGTAFGIAQAHLTGATGNYLLELRGVPFRATLKPGDLIVSSGWGGVIPRGIPVGTVLQEIKTAEGWARTYLLRPAVNPADVYSIMILRRDRVQKEDMVGVWESVAQANAAAQRIVVAGDSAAKEAALAEAAARRAVLDSAARANGVGVLGQSDSARRADSVKAAEARAAAAAPGTKRPADSAAGARRDNAPRDSVRRDTVPRGPGAVR